MTSIINTIEFSVGIVHSIDRLVGLVVSMSDY